MWCWHHVSESLCWCCTRALTTVSLWSRLTKRLSLYRTALTGRMITSTIIRGTSLMLISPRLVKCSQIHTWLFIDRLHSQHKLRPSSGKFSMNNHTIGLRVYRAKLRCAIVQWAACVQHSATEVTCGLQCYTSEPYFFIFTLVPSQSALHARCCQLVCASCSRLSLDLSLLSVKIYSSSASLSSLPVVFSHIFMLSCAWVFNWYPYLSYCNLITDKAIIHRLICTSSEIHLLLQNFCCEHFSGPVVVLLYVLGRYKNCWSIVCSMWRTWTLIMMLDDLCFCVNSMYI